jgi:SSS family solute:Na+ symporter
MNLGWFDWGFTILYVAGVFAAGSIVKRYIGGISDFLVAGRQMGFTLGLLSLMCTEIAIMTFMYYAELGYSAGLAALIVALPPFVAFLIVGKTGFIIRPLLEMKIMTLPEFFRIKFGPGVQLYVAVLMAAGGVLNFAVFPGVEAQFISTLTGVPRQYLLLIMVVVLTVSLLYTLVGGMVSVLITNYIQYALLSAGMILITILGFAKTGWPKIVQSVAAHMGPDGVNPFSPSLFQSEFGFHFLVWQLLTWVATLTSWQAIAIRIFSAKDAKTGTRIFTWSSLMFLSRAVLPIFWGVLAFAYLGPGENALNALPKMLTLITPRGLLGIIFASLIAASMSTYSSYLLSWSSVVSQDVIGAAAKRITKKEISSRTQILISRVTMAALMIFIIWWSLFHKVGDYLYFYLNMTANLFVPGTLAAAALGIYWKRSRPLGAYVAFTLSAGVTLLYFMPRHPDTSTLGWASFALAFTGMVVGSYIQNMFKLKNEAE